jgi:hypothetical protein
MYILLIQKFIGRGRCLLHLARHNGFKVDQFLHPYKLYFVLRGEEEEVIWAVREECLNKPDF